MELNRRYQSLGVTCNAVHPGNLIYTSLCQKSWLYWTIFLLAKPFHKNPVSLMYKLTAVSKGLKAVNGEVNNQVK